MPAFVLTQGLTGNITLPAPNGNVIVPVVSSAAIQAGQIVQIIHPAGAGAGGTGQATFNVVNTAAQQFTGRYMNILGDTGPGSVIAVGGIPVTLVYDPDFQFSDANELLRLSSCWDLARISDVDREAIMVYARIKNLAAIGGTDYSSALTTLLVDSNSWKDATPENRRQIEAYVTLLNANTAGAALSFDVNTLKTAAIAYRTIPMNRRKNVLGYLKTLINSRGVAA